MRDFNRAERAIITAQTSELDDVLLEFGELVHPIGDRLSITETGYLVWCDSINTPVYEKFMADEFYRAIDFYIGVLDGSHDYATTYH